MPQITCKCGNTYDSSFKFCPECATPNPKFTEVNSHSDASSTEQSIKPLKKKFTKVGESTFNKQSSSVQSKENVSAPISHTLPKKKGTIIRQSGISSPVIQPKQLPKADAIYEDYEDEIEDEKTDIQDYDFEDEDYKEETVKADNSEYDDIDDDYYEDEIISDSSVSPAPSPENHPLKNGSKVLGAPGNRIDRTRPVKNISSFPKTKTVSQTKSSLGKENTEYDPNHDGYYDDRLPAILDEVTKTSHLDVLLKISLSAICIAALITYCIFYVQV
ncbi:MAG: hypothetical protein K6A23_10800 [Butyrivibrio sp.]|nr:hypothetical protein [Butyrivibrio sp.]